MKNKEIIKFIFNDSNKIDNSDYSWNFIKQIINADAKDYELDIDNFKNLYIWKKGTWNNGYWKSGKWYNGTWHNGTWKGGIWKDGTWENGKWHEGVWENGKWVKGKIYDSKRKKHIESTVPPNECKWSLSYGK